MSEKAAEFVLVEDSPEDVEFFVHAFKKAGLPAQLHVLTDGAEALEFVYCAGRYANRNPANRPKVIILDLKLPKVGGLEVLRRLKADTRTRTIPIVVLSSSQEERDLVESYDLGVNSYIVKPMEFDQYSQAARIIGQYWLEFNHTPKL